MYCNLYISLQPLYVFVTLMSSSCGKIVGLIAPISTSHSIGVIISLTYLDGDHSLMWDVKGAADC